MIIQSPRAANYWKRGLPSKDLCKYSTDFTPNQIPKSYPAHRWKAWKNYWLWFHLQWLKSYSPNKVKKAHYIMTYSVASFYTIPKNVMLFGFLVRRAFPTIYMYVMNDFEAIIFQPLLYLKIQWFTACYLTCWHVKQCYKLRVKIIPDDVGAQKCQPLCHQDYLPENCWFLQWFISIMITKGWV